MVKRGGEARSSSYEDKNEDTQGRISRHADKHGQPSVDVLESRIVEGGRGAKGSSHEDEKEGAEPKVP